MQFISLSYFAQSICYYIYGSNLLLHIKHRYECPTLDLSKKLSAIRECASTHGLLGVKQLRSEHQLVVFSSRCERVSSWLSQSCSARSNLINGLRKQSQPKKMLLFSFFGCAKQFLKTGFNSPPSTTNLSAKKIIVFIIFTLTLLFQNIVMRYDD